MAALAAAYHPGNHHDAAVLALISCFSADADVQDTERWKAMLRMWIAIAADEEFWSAFWDIEQSGGFEPSAARDDFDQLQANALNLVAEPIAELARDAASRRNFDRCRRALEVVRTAGFPLSVAPAVEEEVLGPYEDALGRVIKDIRAQCWDRLKQDRNSGELNKQVCAVAISHCKEELEPRYAQFIAMASRGCEPGSRATKDYADLLVSVGNALTWADQWVEAEATLAKALSLLGSDDPARERIEAVLRNVAGSAARQRSEAQREAGRSLDDASKAMNPRHETAIRNSANQSTGEENQYVKSGISGFLKLCEAIRTRCWLRVQEKDAGFFKAARADYKRQVAPWLAIILDAYRDDNDVIAKARNAAAGCLYALASGLMGANELDAAETLAQEAFVMVCDDKMLEREIERRIGFIRLEKERLAPKIVRSGAPLPRPKFDPRKVAGSARKTEAKAYPRGGNRTADRVIAWFVGTGLAISVGLATFILMGEVGDSGKKTASTTTEGQVFVGDPAQFSATPPAPTHEEAPTRSVAVPSSEAFLKSRPPVSLPSGANIIAPRGTNGLGRLTISNYSDDDAAVKIKTDPGSKTVRFVYIRAMKDVTVRGIGPGDYLLQFTTGRDWDRTTRSFRESQTFAQFDRQLSFVETPMNDNSIEYSTYKITLHEVANGNVQKEPISAAEFDNNGAAELQGRSGR